MIIQKQILDQYKYISPCWRILKDYIEQIIHRSYAKETAPQKKPISCSWRTQLISLQWTDFFVNGTVALNGFKQLKLVFPGSNVQVKGPVAGNLPFPCEVSHFFWFHDCSIKFYRVYWEVSITEWESSKYSVFLFGIVLYQNRR